MSVKMVRVWSLRLQYKYCAFCGAIVDVYSVGHCEYCRPNSVVCPPVISDDNIQTYYETEYVEESWKGGET
jgi:hypothetical protein